MKQLKEFLKRQRKKIAIAIVPIVLLFSHQVNISWSDRWKYFTESVLKSAPLLFLYAFVSEWYDENKVFAISLSTALLINLLAGAKFHWLRGTFSLERMLLKNIEMLLIVFMVYALLKALANPLDGNYAGALFRSTIEFISILFPASKALKNIFIITKGKHPPKFIMEALYNFEKDGKLKDFFDTMNGKGLNNSSFEEDNEADVHREQSTTNSEQ